MNVNIQKTTEYYKTAKPCDCDVCRYFCSHIRALRPDIAAYLDTLGWILHRRGQHEDAIEAYHKALSRLKEPDAEIAAHVALAFEALGRAEEAAYWWAAVPTRNAKGPAPGPEEK